MSAEVKNAEDVSVQDAPFIPDSSLSHDTALSNFSQVIFPDIPDFFLPETDTALSYILTEAIQPTPRDWVGLFKVGWASPREYFTYVWSSVQNDDDSKSNKGKVTFKASQLPRDDSEFYQFCYVTARGYVRGASTPFQFRVCTENDHLVEVEDETGLIILKTKSDTLEEKISSLHLEKESLQETIEKLTKAKLDFEIESQKLAAEVTKGKERCQITEDKNNKLQATLVAKTKELEKLTKRLSKADSRIEKTKAQLAEAEVAIGKLTNELDGSRKLIKKAELQRIAAEEKHAEELNVRDKEMQKHELENCQMRDKIKTLSLVKEETQKANTACKKEKEEALFASLKMREEASLKMKRFKDERDLFKAQLTESELARQEVLENLQMLTENLGKAENKIQAVEGEVHAREEKLEEVSKKMADLEEKHKHEMNKCQGLLRNSLDHARATKTAKQLVADELSETVAVRDALMEELNSVKQEKEKLAEELQISRSTLHALQCQLETVEEKLASREACLIEHDRLTQKERTKSENAEREMHERILSLEKQLKEAGKALARENEKAAKKAKVVAKKDGKTQTAESSSTSSEAAAESSVAEENNFVITDLRSQVEDLTTRLNMGADAYKEKFIECHKLEKKVKKLKLIYQQAKQSPASSADAVSRATASSSSAEETKQRSEGWGSKLEKLFLAIADPDSEEKEQTLQLHQKLEDLQKNLETSDTKHKRYKQLYKEEKEKTAALSASTDERCSDIAKALDEATSKNAAVAEENQVLRAQLKEFMERSDDVTIRNYMTYRRGVSSDELSSSPEAVAQNNSQQEATEDEVQFEDAPGTPMYNTGGSSGEKTSGSSSSDATGSSPPEQKTDSSPLGGFTKFNMCSERSQAGAGSRTQGTASVAIPRKSRVINRQPIRSPTQLPEIAQTSSQSSARGSGQVKKRSGKSGKASAKGKSRKSVKGVM